MAGEPSFKMLGSGWLRRHGVEGDTNVSLTPNAIRIAGEKGGTYLLYAAQVRRMRSGWQSVKHGPFYDTLIWMEGEEKPARIHTRGTSPAGYAAVVRGFAAQVARAGRLDRLWRGTSILDALWILVPMALLFLAAAAIGIFALDGPLWQRAAPAFVPALLVWLGIHLTIKQWPRPVRSLEEFNAEVAPDLSRRDLRGRLKAFLG